MVVGKEHLISGIPMVGTKKSLGQHWLKNREILEKIATLAGEGELCVEIGPGLGTMTSSLLKRFDKVIAIEYDDRLASNLPKSFPGKNLEVVNEDVLKYDFSRIFSGDMTKTKKYVIAGNIPYYITSPILEKVIKLEPQPEKIVLLVQKEVAERILDDKETTLSLFVKNYADVSAGLVVKREEFSPPPKVDSQVLVLKPHAPIVSDEVFKLIRQAFSSPRKKLIHNLVGLKSKDELIEIFEEVGISLDARPGDLHLQDYLKISEFI